MRHCCLDTMNRASLIVTTSTGPVGPWTCTTIWSVDDAPSASWTTRVNVMSRTAFGATTGETNVGVAVSAPASWIRPPALCVHVNSVMAPVEPRPLSATSATLPTVWSGPALATTLPVPPVGASTATSTVDDPPAADCTVTDFGGMLPGGRPQGPPAAPSP